VADVSGDGIPAALIMAAFRALLRYNAKRFTDPGDLMKLMNELVPEFMRSRDFISIYYGILDYKSHKFKYCNCGHNPSLLWQEDKIRLLEKTGPSLNLLKVADFNTNEIILNNNDLILLYTDGVVEVFDKSGEQFGLSGLNKVFEKHSTKTPVELIENITFSTREFNSSDIYNDDFTLLVLKRNDTIN
jgi:phosphoserine phosphatase RsbU/P